MRPQVHTFPSADAAFRDAVAEATKRALGAQASTQDVIRVVADRVRDAYPNAAVVERSDEASYEHSPVWYAYRDGRVRRPDPQRERLYETLGSARRSVREAEELLERSRKSAKRAGFRG